MTYSEQELWFKLSWSNVTRSRGPEHLGMPAIRQFSTFEVQKKFLGPQPNPAAKSSPASLAG